jgi:GT2 family glycosyltransferase
VAESGNAGIVPGSDLSFPLKLARLAGSLRRNRRRTAAWPARTSEPGISVVIPSRNGKGLLEAQMPDIWRQLAGHSAEVIVVDNGSDDGTAQWLASNWPKVQADVSPKPLGFAGAVNRGIERARYSHVCLLNNDMQVEADFFSALRRAFDSVTDLFCATAQIFFPPGARREETGKAFLGPAKPDDFPVRCDEPLAGEDQTYVLYGSGGCSLYHAEKLRALGGMDRAYEPVYVEDMDIGYRAWQRGWPSVYVAGSRVVHQHRTTTSKYYTEQQLEEMLEVNYLKFLARDIASKETFKRLWGEALERLRIRAGQGNQAAVRAVRAAWKIAIAGGGGISPAFPEEQLLALGNGTSAVFPGRPRKVKLLTVSREIYPAGDVLVAYTDELQTPPAEVLDACSEAVLVRRGGGHAAFHAALRQTVRKWRPERVNLRGQEMARYAADCSPALVERVD